ncbi:FxSxx-COOH system tetratricopeptide repeat protein [Streptomyces muensis]|uniref:FxSxx-COOH system tetratricopeptide repeat protein n=1 Tax=Streptomyces muensis TaxID=1077944 RepID=A0A9X1TXK4_STRM4|nr:FxSxx-COOH system tetratricopeptide repeat protein [Streptomyces muensis]MCF1599383.1 FxSxx-COOH system tetratricopeptide repeat protein [Streptomyces muensis]
MASAFQPRTALREQITARPAVLLSGGGGVGKSQLAAACAHQASADGTDLVVWLDATDTARMVTGYATAARRVQAPDARGEDTEADAKTFFDWLAATSRSWLIVLDNLTDLEGIAAWWPPHSAAGTGRVLATTRRRDARLSGGGRSVVAMDTYSPEEADTYLRDRFAGAGMDHLRDGQSAALLHELGHLPLASAHAAAYMLNEDVPCGDYLRLFTDRRSRPDTVLPRAADTEGYGLPVTTALLITLDAVQRREPVGLAVPALRLTAHLDPAGHPLGLWAEAGVGRYLDLYRTPGAEASEVTADEARAAVHLLHEYALINGDFQDSARTVRIHALTARAVRENTPEAQAAAGMRTAADALLGIWPETEHPDAELTAVLRANAATLSALAGDLLWQDGGHPVLYEYGLSLLHAGLYEAAVTHWQRLTADAGRLLDDGHDDIVLTRAHLMDAYRRAHRTDEAIACGEQLVADLVRRQGADSADAKAIRGSLSAAYWLAGRHPEAITAAEQAVTDAEELLGEDDPVTVTTRSNLAAFYAASGRANEAIPLAEAAVADRERLFGTDDTATTTARSVLAGAYESAGRIQEALALQSMVVQDQERLLGRDHPTALEARLNLVGTYLAADRPDEAITLCERSLSDAERLLGTDHPTTLAARSNLAHLHAQTTSAPEAIPLLVRAAGDCERVLGPDHPYTLQALGNLGIAYSGAGRHSEAIALLLKTVSYARRLGRGHPDHMTALRSLAWCYQEAGRPDEATSVMERFAAEVLESGAHDSETISALFPLVGALFRVERGDAAIELLERLLTTVHEALGQDHPETLLVGDALAHCLLQMGRARDAIPLLERIAAGYERRLGRHDGETISAWGAVAIAYTETDRAGEAITLLEALVSESTRELGADHPAVRDAHETLAIAYLKAGRYGAAARAIGRMIGGTLRRRWGWSRRG